MQTKRERVQNTEFFFADVLNGWSLKTLRRNLNQLLQPTEDVLPGEELVRVVLEDLEVLEVDVEQGEVRLFEGGPAGHLLDDLARLAREVGEGEGRRVSARGAIQ